MKKLTLRDSFVLALLAQCTQAWKKEYLIKRSKLRGNALKIAKVLLGGHTKDKDILESVQVIKNWVKRMRRDELHYKNNKDTPHP